MQQSIRQLMEAELNERSNSYSLFKDENILTFDYMPENMPHRDSQILEMTRYLRGIFNKSPENPSFRQSIILVGPVGSGKTSAAKRLGLDLEEYAIKKMPYTRFIYRHLNCRRSRTVYLLLIDLMKSLSPKFPHRGFSASELIHELITTLEQMNLYLLLTLDEIDYLFRDSEINTLLYTFTRINDDNSYINNQRISLVVITRNKEFLYLLDPSTKSSLAKNIVKFPSYTKEQLNDILTSRVILGIKEDIISDELILSIAKFASDKGGDARLVIEILWRSIKIAENKNDLYVKADHVRLAQINVDPISKEILEDLPLQQKVTLLSIGKVFHLNPDTSTISLTKLKKQFVIECKSFNLSIGKGHTSLWSYVQKLSDLGLIHTWITSKGTKGRVTEITLELPVDSLISDMQTFIEKDLNA
ncbi:MAG: ORC1-type DNA replication protein 2 [Candidatus Heimdallarchaeota archaeon LC_3]|nr:MAG: ORC1-type DNA replication protein 2 [Candidatus Heimdallarchaeota archaeon LC_3]